MRFSSISLRKITALGLVYSFSLLSLHAEAVATSGKPETPLTVWELLLAGGWVMIPLLLASFLAVTLVIFNFFNFRESAIVTPEMVRRMQPFLENEDLQGLAGYLSERPQAVARVLDQTLRFLYRHPDADPEAIKAVAEAEGTRIAAHLNQRLVYLMDLGVMAPMLGLFGTVIGLLRSFGSIAGEASPMRTLLLAGGVSQALVSTAMGLIVGIVAMGFFSFFRGRVQNLVSILEGQCTILIQEVILLKKRRSSNSGVLVS